jgi:hypothetical protein
MVQDEIRQLIALYVPDAVPILSMQSSRIAVDGRQMTIPMVVLDARGRPDLENFLNLTGADRAAHIRSRWNSLARRGVPIAAVLDVQALHPTEFTFRVVFELRTYALRRLALQLGRQVGIEPGRDGLGSSAAGSARPRTSARPGLEAGWRSRGAAGGTSCRPGPRCAASSRMSGRRSAARARCRPCW